MFRKNFNICKIFLENKHFNVQYKLTPGWTCFTLLDKIYIYEFDKTIWRHGNLSVKYFFFFFF